ncbi:hypothetical protein [Leptobacterium sp. I13]|uniref:hypothetical protein n=1 Tax=Leptobacterium meishanense TaxID=3128904 RepID=UPI0030ED8842
MKIINKFSKGFDSLALLTLSMAFIVLQSCNPNKKDSTIEIITEVMDFQTADTIPSGWNTFKYINNSTETHFFLLDKYPEGKTIENAEKEIAPPFQNGMDLINEGKTEEGFAEFNKLPSWFFEVVFLGGSGLVSPKNSSLTTVKLEPGYYIMECYVKMADGTFHSTMGMVKPIIVTNGDSGNLPPEATINISISSTEGIVYDAPIEKGMQVFAVQFKDQIVHENFVGHDVNLVRLDDTANLEALENWMNWADPKGLITPAPEGVTFLGGVNDMPAGNTGYFQVNLEPGNYAFVSEVPNSLKKKMLRTFEVLE